MPSPEDVMIPSLLYTTDASSDESKCEESYAISSFEDILRMQLLSQDPLEYERKNRKDKRLSPKLKLFDVEKANPILSENFEKLKQTIFNPPILKKFIKPKITNSTTFAHDEVNHSGKFKLSSIKKSLIFPYSADHNVNPDLT